MRRTDVVTPWSRLDWLNIALFAGLVVLFYWRILTPNLADRQSFPPGDFAHQFWAFTTFEARELSAGRLPLWNPYTFAGAPFWADVQAAVFYPPSLLTLLLSAPWGFSLFALEVEAIAHFWLAATFMYLFIRQITRSRSAAFIAALTFTFSGYLTGYPSQQLAILEADVWLPLILFFIHRAYEKWKDGQFSSPPLFQSSIPPLLLAGLAWGLALLAGHPQSALIIAYTSTAYLFFLWFLIKKATHPPCLRFTFYVLRPSSWLRPFTAWLIFIATSLGLAAIQFLPAAAYTVQSVRAAGTYDQMAGGFPLTDLIQLILPGQVSFYSPLYIGLTGLILAMWVSLARPSPPVIFWAIFAAVTLLISFGGNTFFYSPLYLSLPGFSIFRGQERWAFATAFSLSVLAGYGFQHLKTCPHRPTPTTPSTTHHSPPTIPHPPITNHQLPITTLQSLTTILLFFALLLVFLFFFGLNDTGWTPDSPFFGLLSAASLLTLLLALVWLLWKLRPWLSLPVFTGLTAALILLDLFSVNWQTNLYPQLPEWHTQMPAVVAAIKDDAAQTPAEPFRVYNEFRLYDNYGVPFALEDLWGASPLRPARYDQFLAPPMPLERAWALLNVKYVITWRQALFVPSTIIYQEPAADGTTYVHRLNAVGPRVWLVNQAQIASDAAILETIADPGFDPRQTALLEPDAAPHLGQLASPDKARGATSISAQTVSPNLSTPTRLSYQITSPIPTLLLLSEPHFPGWTATVDGRSTPILRANYILRAIPVPAGTHSVELTFRPLGFTVGAIISSLTLIAVAVTLIVFSRSRLGRPSDANAQPISPAQMDVDRAIALPLRPVAPHSTANTQPPPPVDRPPGRGRAGP